MPVFGNNVKAVQNKNNNNNFQKTQFSGMPQNDVFEKSSKNVSFTGFKPPNTIGTDFSDYETTLLEVGLENSMDDVWDYAKQQHPTMFKRMNVRQPKIRLTEEDVPEDYSNPQVAKYDWINNVITVNKKAVPNVALIHGGHVALVPQNIAPDFIRKGDMHPGYFEDATGQDFPEVVARSKQGSSYYVKLTPEDTVELVLPAVVEKVDEMLSMHLAYNSFEVGAETFKPYFDEMMESGELPKYGVHDWGRTYPGGYELKVPGNSPYDSEDFRKTKRDGVATGFRHKDVAICLFNPYIKGTTNPLEFSAKVAALDYCEQQVPKGDRTTKEMNRIQLLLDIQTENYRREVQRRADAIKKARE